jgi:hypothetical protein
MAPTLQSRCVLACITVLASLVVNWLVILLTALHLSSDGPPVTMLPTEPRIEERRHTPLPRIDPRSTPPKTAPSRTSDTDDTELPPPVTTSVLADREEEQVRETPERRHPPAASH